MEFSRQEQGWVAISSSRIFSIQGLKPCLLRFIGCSDEMGKGMPELNGLKPCLLRFIGYSDEMGKGMPELKGSTSTLKMLSKMRAHGFDSRFQRCGLMVLIPAFKDAGSWF